VVAANRGHSVILIAAGVSVALSSVFIGLLALGQTIADSSNPVVPWWFVPAWLVLAFPARVFWPSHPFGFGAHDARDLVIAAALNGLAWGGAILLIGLVWRARRRLTTR
jgi:hypothetical protein